MTPPQRIRAPQEYPDSSVCGESRVVAGEDMENGISFSLVVPCGTSSYEAVDRLRQTLNLATGNRNYRLWIGTGPQKP